MITSGSPLITPADLASSLGDHVILDIRSAVDGGGRAAFEVGHVPGAVHTDYVTGGWRVARDGGAGMLPDARQLGALLGGLGIQPDNRVVVAPAGVSAGDFAAASRVYWTLKAAGHRAVAMLDGGTAAWVMAGLPVESGPGRTPEPAPAYPVVLDPSIRATVAEVERSVAEGSATLLDTRNASSFVGDEKSPLAARAGRIPGALHQEGARGFDPGSNRLKPRAELEQLFGHLPDGDAIAFCNSGQQAATNWFVLSEVLGRDKVRLYDGSMSEWTSDPARPVETGPASGAAHAKR